MSKAWVIPLAVVAALVAGTLIVNDFGNVIDALELADPTGSFGIYFHLGGLAANLAVVLLAICVSLPNSPADFRLGYAVVAFVPSILEALAALPCFLAARPGALCGVGAVFVAWLAVPIVLGAAVAFTASARHRWARLAGVVAAVAFVGSAGAGQVLLAPATAERCRSFSEVTKRSNCLNVFAIRAHDEELCRAIEFRAIRFTCLREVAIAKREVGLCDEIADAAPIGPGEASARFYRDACFQNMAYAMHDRSQCHRVEDPGLRASCERALH